MQSQPKPSNSEQHQTVRKQEAVPETASPFPADYSLSELQQENYAECLAERTAIMQVSGGLDEQSARVQACFVCFAEIRNNEK